MSAQVPVLVLLQSLKNASKLLCSEGQAKHPLLTVTGTAGGQLARRRT